MNGHYPKPGGLAAALAVLIAVVLAACSPKGAAGGDAACGLSDDDFRTEGILQAIPVRATFLDEVSWDIPHQNWGVREWDADFRAMKNMGINTVVLIRAGLGRWIAAPFECLLESEEVYYPPVDLVEMFLTLADKYGMDLDTVKKYLRPEEVKEQVIREKVIKVVADSAKAVAPAEEKAELEAEGTIHLALVYRGDRENADKFLTSQDEIILELYPPEPDPEEKPQENPAESEPAADSSETAETEAPAKTEEVA